MAEGNGFVSSGDPRVDAALQRLQEKNDARFKDLEDAMLVHAHLEAAAGRRLKEHARFIEKHEEMMEKHRETMADFDTRMREIGEKVDFLVDREMKREGGPEAG